MLFVIFLAVFFGFDLTSRVLTDSTVTGAPVIQPTVHTNSPTGGLSFETPKTVLPPGVEFFNKVSWLFQGFAAIFTVFVIKSMGY